VLEVRIINRSGNPLPAYATDLSAGMDLYANNETPVVIGSLERAMIPTGIFIELPPGYEAQVRPRSGLAARHGITMLNSPGTIDADYRGEIHMIAVNLSREPFTIRQGERIAQLVIARHERVSWTVAEALSGTSRGEGGFGHTGI
jgi:dUTP pyrophosphatase